MRLIVIDGRYWLMQNFATRFNFKLFSYLITPFSLFPIFIPLLFCSFFVFWQNLYFEVTTVTWKKLLMSKKEFEEQLFTSKVVAQ